MTIFKIGSNDYTNNVLNDGNYKVNNVEEYIEWTDANFTIHRDIRRKRVSGTFNMMFRTKASYEAFIAYIASTKTNGYNICEIKCNNEINTLENVKLFINFTPTLEQKNNMQLDYGRFQVSVEGA